MRDCRHTQPRTNFLASILAIAFAGTIACTGGSSVGDYSAEEPNADTSADGDDAPASDGDHPQNFTDRELVSLDPPDDTPYPLKVNPPESAKLTCEGTNGDGDRVTLAVADGVAHLHLEAPAGDVLIDDEFEISSYQQDNLPRVWISGPDIKISLADNYGCYRRIRVQASLESDVYEHSFARCLAHRKMDDMCMRN